MVPGVGAFVEYACIGRPEAILGDAWVGAHLKVIEPWIDREGKGASEYMLMPRVFLDGWQTLDTSQHRGPPSCTNPKGKNMSILVHVTLPLCFA